MMRASGGHVITQDEFRQRLLALPGWEQFTALMTFFLTEDDDVAGRPSAARLAAKIDYEVTATIDALHVLIAAFGGAHQPGRPPPLPPRCLLGNATAGGVGVRRLTGPRGRAGRQRAA